ncbi:MAG: PVC-type heme-binding CxxCH protein, partial [Planctomycetaceae bacterium]
MVRLALVVCCGWAAVVLGVKTSDGDDWREQSVPGEWSTETATRVADAGGVGWYRSWMLPHPSCFGKAPNDLASESVGLNLSGLAGSHRAFVNGRDVGSGDGAGTHRHKIPAGVLQAGQWNEIAIRVTVPSSEARAGGFADEAPFVMSYFHECVLAGSWMFAVGDAVGRTAGPLPERPGAAAFDTVTESSRVLGRTAQVAGPRLEPEETAARMRTADPYRIELLLHEPLVAQPFHVSFDERGRMWVTQSRQYPYPAGVRMISRDKYYRSHYDRVPPAPPSHDRGADVISVHESSRRDGVYDRHTVYLDGLNMASASLHGRGGTWVMHTPHLLFYPDADGNGPDGDPEVRLTGFGLEDSHAIANGLAWGPDGWLYGAQGSTTSCLVRRPGLDTDKAGAAFTGAMIWRYHPDSLAFEIVAEGGGNTFGVEFDEFGRLFSGHNGGGTRGFHYVPGGLYRTPDVDPGKYGPPANPHAYGELPALATVDAIPRFTHFGACAVGTGLPVTARGHLFALDPLHNLVTDTALVPRGSTFSTRDAEPAVRCEDPAFRPVYVATAPDGSLVVCDMYDFYVAHGQHYQNQIDSSTGRIWRLRGRDADLETDTDLSSRSSADVVELLDHDNGWHRRTAVRLLGERRDSGVAGDLASRVASLDPREAVHALWALHQAGGVFPSDTDDEGRSAIEKATASPHAAVRGWAVRLLGDDYGVHRGPGLGGHAGRLGRTSPGRLPDGLQKRLLKLAREDADAEVLVQLASTARRLDREQALDLIAALLGRPGFGDDSFLPMMGWWVLEALYDTGDSVANEPLVRLFETRRAGSAPARESLPGDSSGGRVEGWLPTLISQDAIAPTVARRLARRLAADGSR